jgi:peroxiredoxin
MNRNVSLSFASLMIATGMLGCTPSGGATESSGVSSSRDTTAPATVQPTAEAPRTMPSSAVGKAEIGKPAPAFTLQDETGKSVSLDSFKGKVVVLEWFNPDCPFVKASHERGSMKAAMKKAADQGAVWLAINSAAAGKQGHGASRNADAKKQWSLGHPVLMDESGTVGRAYGAQRTPHMYVIDASGVLVYAGAIDNSPDGERGSPKDGKMASHVEDALDDVAAKRAVRVPSTEAYGCSVKYGG